MATGGITLNGSTQYLELNSGVLTSFPCSLVVWCSITSNQGCFPLAQQLSSGSRVISAFLDANGTTKYAYIESSSGNSNSAKTSAPHTDATLQMFVAVFTSTTSRKCYFGDAAPSTVDTTSVADNLAAHDRITIGAGHYNGGAANLFLAGTVAEAHLFNAALSDANVTTLLTTPPEDVTGWVDGWMLATNSDLTSIGGTRTLTAVGSPTTGSLTLPYTRTAAPVLTAPTGSATGNTTANAGATIDTVSGSGSRILYALPRVGGSAASAATIIAIGTQLAVTSSGAKSVPLTGLTTNVGAVADLVYVDATLGQSNVVTTPTFTPPTMASSGSLAAQSGTASTAFTWAGATPESQITQQGVGASAWTLTSAGGSGLSTINSSTGVPGGTLTATPGVYTVTVTKTDSSTAGTNPTGGGAPPQTIVRTASVTVASGGGGGDTTPPTLSGMTASGGVLTCSASVTTNEANGTLYTVFCASSTPPSAAQVEAGQDSTGAAALRAVSQAVTTTGSQSVATGAVTAGTRYAYAMHKDAAGNQSAVAASSSFTVSASGAINMMGPFFNNTFSAARAGDTVHFSWFPNGRVGSLTGITPTEGSAVVDADGMVNTGTTGTGLCLGAVRQLGATTDEVFYQGF